MLTRKATAITMASFITVGHHYGWGRHFKYLDSYQKEQSIKFNEITQGFGNCISSYYQVHTLTSAGIMGSTFGRLSFIILMLQLFGNTKLRRISLWTLFATQVITNVLAVILIYTQCKDVRSLWDFSIPHNCWPPIVQTNVGYAHTALNGATDLILTCLPASMLWKLQMHLRLKAGLAFLLGLSIFAFVAVILKMTQLGGLSHNGDYTWNTVPLFTWVIVEVSMVDIAASTPLLRPLFTGMKAQPHSSSYELGKYGGGSNVKSGEHFRRFSKMGSVLVSAKGRDLVDTDSEEGILSMQSPAPVVVAARRSDGLTMGITKSTSYQVQYHQRPDSIKEASVKQWEV